MQCGTELANSGGECRLFIQCRNHCKHREITLARAHTSARDETWSRLSGSIHIRNMIRWSGSLSNFINSSASTRYRPRNVRRNLCPLFLEKAFSISRSLSLTLSLTYSPLSPSPPSLSSLPPSSGVGTGSSGRFNEPGPRAPGAPRVVGPQKKFTQDS